jgi:hypothetical protein
MNNTSVENKHLIEGSMFKNPNTNDQYRIGRIKNGTYMVIDLNRNEIKNWTRDNFKPLKYIGWYDFKMGEPGKTTYPQQNAGKSKRRRHKTRQTKRRKHRKSKSRRHCR